MAFLTTGEFYQVTFLPSNDAAWVALTTYPSIPSALMDAIVNGTAVVVYVTDSASGTFSFVGGAADGFDDTVLATTSSAFSKLVTTSEEGYTWVNGLDGAGGWWLYDPNAGLVHEFSAGEQSALAGFL